MANKPGREISQTVAYFPHLTKHGKTLPIIESRFGNDGYATWFKVLEMLGQARGHFYDCKNALDWQFLAQKCRVDENMLTEILDLLASLGAIDPDLWKEKVIWSDNFVANLAPLYRRRKAELPSKPNLCGPEAEQAPISDDTKPAPPDINPSKPAIPPTEITKGSKGSKVNKESGKPDLPPKEPLKPEPKKLLELLDETCKQIAALPRKNGQRFNPWQWVVWSAQRSFHPKAISHVLDLLVVNWQKIETPWTYACKIIEKESGNFYERDNGKISEQEKSEWHALVAKLKAVHGNGG
jgi:hypothetical protein